MPVLDSNNVVYACVSRGISVYICSAWILVGDIMPSGGGERGKAADSCH